jgi:hypothetical protein
VLGISPRVPDFGTATATPATAMSYTATLAAIPTEHRIVIPNRPRRWLSLVFNTTADLYEHLSAVALWVDQARRTVVLPLMATYEPAKLRTAADFNIATPDGLFVHSIGFSKKERLFLGEGDDEGWHHTLQQLSKGQFRELTLVASAWGPSGRSDEGPGDLNVQAVLRNLSTWRAEQLGHLKLSSTPGLLDRVHSFDALEMLSELGQLAVDTIPGGHAFLELERPHWPEPIHPSGDIVPVSSPIWTSPPGTVEFRPELIEFRDPRSRNRKPEANG